MLLSLEELLTKIDRNGKVAYQNWFTDIKKFYHMFFLKAYPKEEDRELIKKSRRMKVLFKYWAINNVKTESEAINSIPLCRYCHTELAMPRCTEPTEPKHEWIVSCRCEECVKKYVYDQTSKSVKQNHGVDNISSDLRIRLLKSQIQRNNHLDHGDKITAKRVATIKSKYGDEYTNISQLSKVKSDKENTTTIHYGVPNPQFNSNVNIEKSRNSLARNHKGYPYIIEGRTFYFLDPDEQHFVELLCRYINYYCIMTNSTPVERFMKGRSYCYTPDINIANIIYVECKSCSAFSLHETNEEYLKEHIDIMTHVMEPNQRYILLVRPSADKHMYLSLKSDGTYKIFASHNEIRVLREYFSDDIVYKASNIILNIPYFDLRLIAAMYKFCNYNNEIFKEEVMKILLNFLYVNCQDYINSLSINK